MPVNKKWFISTKVPQFYYDNSIPLSRASWKIGVLRRTRINYGTNGLKVVPDSP